MVGGIEDGHQQLVQGGGDGGHRGGLPQGRQGADGPRYHPKKGAAYSSMFIVFFLLVYTRKSRLMVAPSICTIDLCTKSKLEVVSSNISFVLLVCRTRRHIE